MSSSNWVSADIVACRSSISLFKGSNSKDGIPTARFVVEIVNLDEAGFIILNIETLDLKVAVRLNANTTAATATSKNTAARCNNIGVNCTLTVCTEDRHNCL